MVSVSLTAQERDTLVALLEVTLSQQGRDNSLESRMYMRTSKKTLEAINSKLLSAM